MALVKGPNGQVIDVHATVASGLVGGGHAEYVDEAGNPVDEPVEIEAEAEDSPEPPAKDAKGAKS